MTQQKTSKTVEEARCLPHLPNEIILMIFDKMIEGAAADCQPITWEIYQSRDPHRRQRPRRKLQDDVTAYSRYGSPDPRDKSLIFSRFNGIRLPLQVCSRTRAMALKTFHPLRYRSHALFLDHPHRSELIVKFKKEDCVWACPALDVFQIMNTDIETKCTQPWPFAPPWPFTQISGQQAFSRSQPSATANGILRVVQNVRFDCFGSGITFLEELSGALEWSLSLPSTKRVYIDKHETQPGYGLAGLYRWERFRLDSRKFGPKHLHLVGLPDGITSFLRSPTTDKALWKVLRSRRIPVVIRLWSSLGGETVPLELFLDEKDEICFRLFCQ
ncbi:hypothetical protein CNYM01_07449 [Colletotrichum nymphaeae SA-01]|uniref:Uncharacterized protein n=1 Tax=Colletotrichum nymphaeae SA-01 TaxID=1460502 RepID=A0A135SCK5_9PEZI|nr:hypothetical protein CNYM01_07449 [Colletotrichum nymphaeae SA-01]